ncbi:MAG: tRNA pseudouridine(55) synthase TruB [Acidobacteriota bacterium]|nr:tRNA pseudouridine(55) synthase TruB [Acidobacteriota bacterium]
MDGVFVIDKPEGWTSHDVVAKFRGAAKTRRVGHLGTLDPMATGVLPLVVGNATRLARFYTHAAKTYEAEIQFGFATDTYDRTGTPTSEPVTITLTEALLEAALQPFRGLITQIPPQYSAKKVNGAPAYKSARQNIAVELRPIEVEIHQLAVLSVRTSTVRVNIRCSGGTYIRTLAHDLGQALGCGAHLINLRRTVSGDFTLAQANTLIPLSGMLPEFSTHTVDVATAMQIRQGRDFSAPHETPHLKVVSESGELIAIAEQTNRCYYHPAIVLA